MRPLSCVGVHSGQGYGHIKIDPNANRDYIQQITAQFGTPMQVSIRELKAHLSRYLAQARQGTSLEITSHRRVVARVTGVPEPAMPVLGALIARGAAQWDGNKPQGAHIVLSHGGIPVSRIVLEDRG